MVNPFDLGALRLGNEFQMKKTICKLLLRNGFDNFLHRKQSMDKRPLILVVDDEVEILRVLTKSLEDEYRVETAGRPSEALKKLTDDVAVVISDQRMPEMFGAELLRRVRQEHPDTVRIIMSGYSDMNALIDSVNQGEIFRYIQKPWDLQKLLNATAEAVKKYEENRGQAVIAGENVALRDTIEKMQAELTQAKAELNKLSGGS